MREIRKSKYYKHNYTQNKTSTAMRQHVLDINYIIMCILVHFECGQCCRCQMRQQEWQRQQLGGTTSAMAAMNEAFQYSIYPIMYDNNEKNNFSRKMHIIGHIHSYILVYKGHTYCRIVNRYDNFYNPLKSQLIDCLVRILYWTYFFFFCWFTLIQNLMENEMVV